MPQALAAMALPAGIVFCKKESGGVAALLQFPQNADVQIAVPGAADIRKDNGDGAGGAAPQQAGLFVDAVAQGPGRFLHQPDLLTADIPFFVQHVGHGGVGDAGSQRDIFDGGHTVSSFYEQLLIFIII